MSAERDRLASALSDRYRIEREIGAGGMATVYLAEDLRHGRKVAIKVLQPELAAVIGAERFLGEIKTTANLQHPHILALHDSGNADGFLFFVMPYVDGESLRDRLNREKQLPIDDAVRIATEVAEALEYAHNHGVIHRDIKPDNILLQQGRVVVADFGIALAVQQAGGNRLTETGLSVGTPQYMSPEQAAGDRELDGRSDLYSAACVLYEMLTGEPPHAAATAQAVLARVLTEQPQPLRKRRGTVPRHIEAAVHTALQKLPADRYSGAGEFARVLHDPALAASAISSSGRGKQRSWWKRAALVAGGVAVAAVTTMLWSFLSDAGTSRSEATEWLLGEVAFSYGGMSVAVSLDGEWVVYAAGDSADQRLFRQRVGSLVATPIAGTDGGHNPFLSPEGAWVGFIRDNGLEKVPIEGGAAVPLVESPEVAPAAGATWGADGWIYFSMYDSGLGRVRADGGPVQELSTNYDAAFMDLPPDGGTLLFTHWKHPPRLGVLDLTAGAERIDSTEEVFAPRFVPPDRLVFGRPDGALLVAPFDLRRGAIAGPARRLANDVEISNWTPQYAVSAAGTLVYVRDKTDQLVLERLDGTDRRIVAAGASFHHPSLSPDESTVAVVVRQRPGRGMSDRGIWTYELETGGGQRRTDGPDGDEEPIWSPDGRWLTYLRWGVGIVREEVQVRGDVEILVEGESTIVPLGYTPQGDLVYSDFASDAGQSLLDMDSGDISPWEHQQLEGVTAHVTTLDYSRDGELLAIESNESGTHQIFVEDSAGSRRPVSFKGGLAPRWAPDGQTLYYVRWLASKDKVAHLVSVAIDRSSLEVGAEEVIADWSRSGFTIGSKWNLVGDDWLVRVVTPEYRDIVVVENWPALLNETGAGPGSTP